MKSHAREMRNEPTEPEKRLWRVLSNRQLDGHKFRRQQVIGQFIADFACPAARLIVEVDGITHDEVSDRRRDRALAEFGYRVLHVTNQDVMRNIDGVLRFIGEALSGGLERGETPHPNPSPEGEGLNETRIHSMNPPVTLQIRDVSPNDAAEITDLLNAIIAEGGTTALEEPFTPAQLEEAYLTGPSVLCCFVAVDEETGAIEGFQTLGRYPGLPSDVGDIGTFARIGSKQRGIGSALFAATKACASALGLSAINATIRADNVGGLAFYAKQGFVDHSVTAAVPLADSTPVDRINKRFLLNLDAAREFWEAARDEHHVAHG